ncbi:hypothetical protein DAH66_17450 [Sphingomonas koreensis]|uniref:Uncharacterized protein n=1 Tax=Sphingomonas koreensis TaxID=93064 RepID=A0A430G001_9SPHN|nr:hypothetical protein [Sphingomonas koreensis]RSY79351.1 hypothetical protein DAH66_17450 [Sphingomonas koreensis]
MTDQQPSSTDILADFASNFRRDSSVFGDYCARYPALARDFTDLAHELQLQDSLAGDAPLDAAAERWIAAAIQVENAVADPFARLDAPAYGALRQALDIPGIVLNAFRDRLVAAGTVPLAFLERLADGLGTGLGDLATYLAGAPKRAPAAQYKADGVPEAPTEKLSFLTLLDEAGVSPERSAALLDEI